MQDEFTACGGIPQLLLILAAAAPKLKVHAAKALRNCAMASAAGRQQVEAAGAIPTLLKLLPFKVWSSGPHKAVQVRA